MREEAGPPVIRSCNCLQDLLQPPKLRPPPQARQDHKSHYRHQPLPAKLLKSCTVPAKYFQIIIIFCNLCLCYRASLLLIFLSCYVLLLLAFGWCFDRFCLTSKISQWQMHEKRFVGARIPNVKIACGFHFLGAKTNLG